MIRAKKYKSRKAPKVDLLRKRGTDYSDYAYREAVSKLKFLLAESYTPVNIHKYSSSPVPPFKGSNYSLANPYEDSPTHDTSYLSPMKIPALTPPKRPDITFDMTPEYSSYLRKQEDYIQQLEKEGRTCREEMARLLSKVRQVISENDRLKSDSKLGSTIETEEESEHEEKERKVRCKHTCSAPNIVYESRISELEAQLTQSRLELRKAQDEAFFHKTKSYESAPGEPNKQIEALQRERDELNATVSNLQMLVNQLREKETAATLKVKRSLDVVDQAHFDKNQLEMEIRRLKSDLERMNDKQREIMQESARRVNEAERRYTLQIERLNGDLAAQWDTANRLNLELDRARRTESELRRELAQRTSVIDELKKELSMKTSNLQTEALTAGAEKETLESELSAQKLAVERAERSGRQESARLQAEVASLRQRLDRADSDLLHSRKENLRLNDTIGSLEKELELAKMSNDSSGNKDSKRSDELTNMIKEMDSKHVQSVADLEGLIQSQTQLMEKLKNECQNLTHRLEDANAKHKEEMASLQNNVDYLSSKLEAPNFEKQGWQGGDGVSTYQNEGGGGTQGKTQEYQGDQSQYQQGDQPQSQQGDQSQYQQGDQGPDKYLGDKTQYPVEPEPYEDDGKKEVLNPADPAQQEEQYQGEETAQAPYQGDPAAYGQGYDPAQYPEGYDPSQYPEGYDPNQYPEGYDPSQYPEGYDPNQYPEGYDPSQYPEGYDPSQYPEGYDPSQYQGEYAEGYPDETGQQQAMPTNVQPAPQSDAQPAPTPANVQPDPPANAPTT